MHEGALHDLAETAHLSCCLAAVFVDLRIAARKTCQHIVISNLQLSPDSEKRKAVPAEKNQQRRVVW